MLSSDIDKQKITRKRMSDKAELITVKSQKYISKGNNKNNQPLRLNNKLAKEMTPSIREIQKLSLKSSDYKQSSRRSVIRYRNSKEKNTLMK